VAPEQIQLSVSSRGIVDHFFCFACDEYVWDCDHLIDERPPTSRFPALDGSRLRSFAYGGRSRVLEIEFQVTALFELNAISLPATACVIQYFDVQRYIGTWLTRCATAGRQERYWEETI